MLLWGLVPCVLCSTLGTASVAYVQRGILSVAWGWHDEPVSDVSGGGRAVFDLCSHLPYEPCDRAVEGKGKSVYIQRLSSFLFGQASPKLVTTTKTMSVICMTFVAAVFLFVAAPLLCQWSFGYLDSRSMYDVQISSDYHNVFDEKDLRQGSYEEVTEFSGAGDYGGGRRDGVAISTGAGTLPRQGKA